MCDKLTYMCGRFERSSSIDIIIKDFRINKASLEVKPSYNIAPSQDILIIRINDNGEKQLEACKWGLLPCWAKDPAMAHTLARSGTTRAWLSHWSMGQTCLLRFALFFRHSTFSTSSARLLFSLRYLVIMPKLQGKIDIAEAAQPLNTDSIDINGCPCGRFFCLFT